MDENLNIGTALPNAFFSNTGGWEKNSKEYEDIEELFESIFSQAQQIINHIQFKGSLGYSYHLSGDLGPLQYEWFLEPLKKRILESKGLFNITFHIPFKDYQLPLEPAFKETLIAQLLLAIALNCSAIVLHAPRTVENTAIHFTDQLCDPEILSILRKTRITLCFENAQDSRTYFQSLEHLLELKSSIDQRLNKDGYGDLTELIQFCFDTGHYLLFQQRDGNEDEDWKKHFKEFCSHIRIVHIHANDGSRDQHLLPYNTYSPVELPESKLPFENKFFFENCHLVMEWIVEIEKNRGGKPHDLVLEIEPFFNIGDIEHFWQKFFKRIFEP